MTTALFIGRFQPFHCGHLKALEYILKKKALVILMLGSAQESNTWDNPFSARERIQMISAVLTRAGLADKVTLVPVIDIGDNKLWVSHVKMHVPAFDSVYSNNPLVQKLFREAGYAVFDTSSFDRGRFEGVKIRALIAESRSWEERVPQEVAAYLKLCGGDVKIKRLKQTPGKEEAKLTPCKCKKRSDFPKSLSR